LIIFLLTVLAGTPHHINSVETGEKMPFNNDDRKFCRKYKMALNHT